MRTPSPTSEGAGPGGRPGGRPRTIEAVPRAILRPSERNGGLEYKRHAPDGPLPSFPRIEDINFLEDRELQAGSTWERSPTTPPQRNRGCPQNVPPPPSNNTWGRAPLRQSLKNIIEIKTVRSNLTSSASIQLCFPRKRRCLMDIIHQEKRVMVSVILERNFHLNLTVEKMETVIYKKMITIRIILIHLMITTT